MMASTSDDFIRHLQELIVMRVSQLQEAKRATGRTTRLIDDAIRLAQNGRAVYVIASQAEEIQQIIDGRMPNSGIKCEHQLPNSWDWLQMRTPGSHPNCVWLLDHYAIESLTAFQSMFEMMTRFDA